MSIESERHHILFTGSSWESGIYTRKLRQLPCLIVPMFAEVEEELHKNIVTVPLLDPYLASHTVKNFHPSRTYTASMYGLMTAIESSAQFRKTTDLQRRVAELTVHAIELQIPFVRQGQLTNEVGQSVR